MTRTNGGPPTLYPSLLYTDAHAAIDLLTGAFGFTRVAVHETEDGKVAHAELAYGNGAVMLGSPGAAAAASTRRWRVRGPPRRTWW
jgi:uncharacterized glyoxalase superfamily protein PhnB